MEPEAKLIAAQAAEELARQQATGQVDEIQRAQLAQQILGAAAQQAKAREAQQLAADFQRMKQFGDVVAKGEMEGSLRNYQRGTERLSGGLQAVTGAISAGAGAYADYQAQQELLAKGLQDAEAKGGIAGALKFLEKNPDYDPGEETLQRLYQQSEMGQQDAAVDTALAALIKQADIAEIQNRNNQRAVKALNRQADEFMAGSRGPTSYDQLQEQVARDIGMTNEQLQQKIADERTMAELKQADRRAFIQSQANQLQQEADDARAMAALRRLDEEAFNLSQLQGFVPSDVRRYDTMEDLLLGRKRLEDAAAAARAREAMGQSVSDSFPLRSPTLEDRLRLLEALGL